MASSSSPPPPPVAVEAVYTSEGAEPNQQTFTYPLPEAAPDLGALIAAVQQMKHDVNAHLNIRLQVAATPSVSLPATDAASTASLAESVKKAPATKRAKTTEAASAKAAS